MMNFANYPQLKVFYEGEDVLVLFFHDGVNTIRDLAEEGLLERSLCYFTFSWFVSKKTVESIAGKVAAARSICGDEAISKHLRFLLNSPEEYDNAVRLLPEECCVLFSNAALLNERQFPLLDVEKTHDAVYNARANSFKRHELTAMVEDKIFVCYDWKEQDLNLEQFEPKEIFRNLKGNKVAKVIQMARVGLMLSEREGACYASLEYLLCGMPVVSTPSHGGRDAYYDETTAIVCDPTPEAVARAVEEAVGKCQDGTFSRDRIRETTLARMDGFRRGLSDSIDASLIALGQAPLPDGMFQERLSQTNKLWKFRNMRTSSLAELAAAG